MDWWGQRFSARGLFWREKHPRWRKLRAVHNQGSVSLIYLNFYNNITKDSFHTSTTISGLAMATVILRKFVMDLMCVHYKRKFLSPILYSLIQFLFVRFSSEELLYESWVLLHPKGRYLCSVSVLCQSRRNGEGNSKKKPLQNRRWSCVYTQGISLVKRCCFLFGICHIKTH